MPAAVHPTPSSPSRRKAHVLRVDCARSAEAAVQRRPGDRIMRASLRPGLTHRGEDRPAASRHGATHRVGCAVAACRRWLLGTALDIMRPGAGARDPGMVSPSAYMLRPFSSDGSAYPLASTPSSRCLRLKLSLTSAQYFLIRSSRLLIPSIWAKGRLPIRSQSRA